MQELSKIIKGIDLRAEFSNLNAKWSIPMLYIRTCKFLRCTCYDTINKNADPDCPYCMGSGFFSSIEKVRAIESSNSPYSSTNSIQATEIGTNAQKNEVYYVSHDIAPKKKDILLKVTWDSSGLPVDIMGVYEIVNIYEMRMENGRVETYGCLIDNRTDQVSSFQAVLKSLPKNKIRVLLQGGKYIWPYRLLTQKNV